MYASKEDMSYVHNLLFKLYRPDQKGRPLKQYYTDFKNVVEEERSIFPIVTDVKKMQEQKELVQVQCFLAGLGPEYDVACSQLLTSGGTLSDVYARLLRVSKDDEMGTGGISNNTIALLSNAKQGGCIESGNSSDTSACVCRYCKKEGHVIEECRKLKRKSSKTSNQNKFANIATQEGILTVPQSSSSTITISMDDYARLTNLQQQSPGIFDDPAVSALANTVNHVACLSTSSPKWIIDLGATDHMTGDTGSSDEADNW